MTPSETALLITSSDQREADRRMGRRPDVLDLYETLASASFDLKATADQLYLFRYSGTDNGPWLRSARSAAERVLAALDEYEREMVR